MIAAIGHTAASPEKIKDVISAGCTLSTHLGNGSHAYLPRLKNYLWEQLASETLSVGIISDGFHLPEAVVKVIAKAKGMEKLILVSDVALLGGCAPGLYKWGNLNVEVFNDRHIGLPGTTFLAGAAHLLDWDIPTFMRFTGTTLATTIRLCTINPAHLLCSSKISDRLSVGEEANIVLFEHPQDDQQLKILKTLIKGKEIDEYLNP